MHMRALQGGHFFVESIAKTILWLELWLPTLHMDAQVYVAKSEECQRTKPLVHRDSMPLRLIIATQAFAK